MKYDASEGAMTLNDFFKWAGIQRTKTYNEIKSGRLKLTKIGGKSLILRSDAERWLQAYASRSNQAA